MNSRIYKTPAVSSRWNPVKSLRIRRPGPHLLAGMEPEAVAAAGGPAGVNPSLADHRR
jgi:hypothetical protein